MKKELRYWGFEDSRVQGFNSLFWYYLIITLNIFNLCYVFSYFTKIKLIISLESLNPRPLEPFDGFRSTLPILPLDPLNPLMGFAPLYPLYPSYPSTPWILVLLILSHRLKLKILNIFILFQAAFSIISAFSGQTNTQFPHPRHLSISNWAMSSIEIALKGQRVSHSPQATHAFLSITGWKPDLFRISGNPL